MNFRQVIGAGILAVTIGTTMALSISNLFASHQVFTVEFVRGERVADGTDAVVQQAAFAIISQHDVSVVITGYAGPGGDPDADAALAQARATDVAVLLTARGVDAGRMTVTGRGAASGGLPARVDILVGR